MNLKDLLVGKGFDPRNVLVLRHRPTEPALNRVLPWLAAERPDVFNAYQQTQGVRVEAAFESMKGSGHVASFIANGAGRALFVGLYEIAGSRPLTFKEFWRVPALIELQALGMKGWVAGEDTRPTNLWFDLRLTDFYAHWKGKLVVGWPTPELSWWRRAHKNEFTVLAAHEDSALEAAMPPWEELDLGWAELRALPSRWRAALAQWRGVYFIFDASDGKGYVGSASGEENVLGRWLGYAATGHGGNRLLRGRDPNNCRFSILQRVSPDMEARDIVRLENTWKVRLHTQAPHGLNDN